MQYIKVTRERPLKANSTPKTELTDVVVMIFNQNRLNQVSNDI